MKGYYDKKVVEREIKEGDKVLILSPLCGQLLKAKYQGPYTIARKMDNFLDYIERTPDQRRKTQKCHINMMKVYFRRTEDKMALFVHRGWNEHECTNYAEVVYADQTPSPSLN